MEVKPYHTSCLHNNRYGLTGKTSKTAKTAKNEAEDIEGRKEIYILADINHIIAILTILAVAIIFKLGPSIPGPETLTRLYNICLQPATAIN
ncbi:hypothetical protein DM02DRAFT_607398, partial [Periconia macrospinosa]